MDAIDDASRTGGVTETALDDLQLALLRSLAAGMSQQQAAHGACVSEATMRRAVRRARERLGAATTIQAVYLAAKKGFI